MTHTTRNIKNRKILPREILKILIDNQNISRPAGFVLLWHKNDQIISVGQTMFDKVKLGQLLMGSYTKNHQWSRQCSRTLICFVPARPAVSTGWRRLEVATTFSSSPPTSQTPASTGALCPPTTSEKLSTSCGYEVTDWRMSSQ